MDLDKKFFRHFNKFLKHFNLWVLLAISLVSIGICALSLRHNNQTALNLRDKVIQADKDNADVETPLRDLRIYIYSHMNTNLASGPNAIRPPIQLKYRYERLLKAKQSQSSGKTSKIYTAAQAYCEAKFPIGLSGSGRIPCIQQYITSHGASQPNIPEDLYKFDFISPLWSPDLAGWSLLVATVFFALFVIKFVMDRWVRAELRDL